MKLKIHVRRKHIDKGAPVCGDRCAIALATREALTEAWGPLDLLDIAVTNANLHIYCRTRSPMIKLSKTVQRFIRKFDVIGFGNRADRRTLRPFSFIIDLP